jgi:hypothetical protein
MESDSNLVARMKVEDRNEHCWPWDLLPNTKKIDGGMCHFYRLWREKRGLLVDGPDAQTPTTDKPAASGQIAEEVHRMVMVKDEFASEDGLPTHLPSALQSSVEAQRNERPGDRIKQESEATAEQDRRINVLQTEVDALQMQLADKQRELDLLRTARNSPN